MNPEPYEPTYVHLFGEERRVCDTCIAIDGAPGIPDFHRIDERGAECQQCYEKRTSQYVINHAAEELIDYLDLIGKIRPKKSLGIPYDATMMFSGGVDSVFALSQISMEVKKRGLTVGAVLIDHGMKGEQPMKNALNVCRHLGVDLHIYQNNLVELYKACYKEGTLACGRRCNRALKGKEMMKKIMTDFDVDHVLTGGDTLMRVEKQKKITIYGKKYRFPGSYSVWQIPSRTLRVVAAYNVNKEDIFQYVRKEHLPWVDPRCGGYDTDCLHPGIGILQLKQRIIESGKPPLEVIIEKGDPIYPFFVDRTQFLPGEKPKFNREKVLHDLVNGNLDAASAQTEAEALAIMDPFF